MKNLIIFLSLFYSLSSWSASITEQAAIDKLNQFFELLDFKVYKKENISQILTDDFQIFEMGKPWDMDEFDVFINDASKTTISTNWTLSDYKVSIDDNSVHISYVNNGVFSTTNNETIYSYWLESVYMVVENNQLKLKFLQSDLINREVE
tara:strand:+ start:3265 stop:3714 length:450 start_codon:yes stop_codon:yes gene_type:complete